MALIPERGVAVYTFAAREASRIYHKAGAGVAKFSGGGAVSVALSMPLPWMVEGFALAVARFEEADGPESVDAKDACIPLFEALSWLNAIKKTYKPASLIGNSDVRALRFVRNRQHHHKAAPVRRGEGVDQWIWHRAETIPEPRRDDYPANAGGETAYQTHLDRKGERVYIKQLADKPVREVLKRLEQKVSALAG
jgi:hypothetical protein